MLNRIMFVRVEVIQKERDIQNNLSSEREEILFTLRELKKVKRKTN